MELKSFDTLDRIARANGTYDALTLDNNNDVALNLLADGVTAVVLARRCGVWVELNRFKRETFFNGGYWSDVDISEAVIAYQSYLSGAYYRQY